MIGNTRIGVVIPCYRVAGQVLDVLARIPPEVDAIAVIDDSCPQHSGQLVEAQWHDQRLQVIYHKANRGVGAAVLTGYNILSEKGIEIAVKIDGDGQMDPALLPAFLTPILEGRADYTKGNRFFDLRYIHTMPALRLAGNLALSFITKLSTGYWSLMDPTNGYTALHLSLLPLLRPERISPGYFFETDILFRLGLARAVVAEVPMRPVYGAEDSSLVVWRAGLSFSAKHLVRFCKRIVYKYYLHDFNIGSLQLAAGVVFLLFGFLFGGYKWYAAVQGGYAATAGTVMLSALPVILGFQSLLAFLQYDIVTMPRTVLHTALAPAITGEALQESKVLER